MKLSLKICWFCLFFIMHQNICYSQLNYNKLPDTLYQEYESMRFVDMIWPPSSGSSDTYFITPAKFKSSYKTIVTKSDYKDCSDCVYEEYIDSLEIRPSYDEIIQLTEVKIRYDSKLIIDEEWAWVKMYEEIPKGHKPCLDVAGIDTCLWKYVIIQEAKYDTLLKKTRNLILDTIKISSIIIPIKKFKLKNKSSQEVEKLTLKHKDHVSVQLYTIEEKAKARHVDPGGERESVYIIRKRLIKAVSPLNYVD